MTYPWSAGEVLTAADLNSAFGLVLIDSSTYSGGTSHNVDVLTGFENYRLVIDNLTASAGVDIYWRFRYGSTTHSGSNYTWNYLGYTETGATSNTNGSSQNIGYTGMAWNAARSACTIDLYNWNTTAHARRHMTVISSFYYSSWRMRVGSSHVDIANAGTGIKFLTNSANTFDMTCTVYGYNT